MRQLFFILIFLIAGTAAYAVPVIDSVVAMTSSCQNNGTITIYAHSSQTLSYAVTSGPVTAPEQSSNVFTALPAGHYVVTVSDAPGDTVSSSVTIGGSYAVLDMHPKVIFPHCLKTNQFLIVGNLTPGTGTAPFTWQTISPSPIIIPVQNTDTFQVNTSGTYTLKCTDACGNVETRQFTFSDMGGSNISFGSISENMISCDSVTVDMKVLVNGDSNDLSFPYTLLLSNQQGGHNSFTQSAVVVGQPVTTPSTTFYATTSVVEMSRTLPRNSWNVVFATIIDGCGDTVASQTSVPMSHTISYPISWNTYSTGNCQVSTSNVFSYTMFKPNNWVVVNSNSHAVVASGSSPAISGVISSANSITIRSLPQDSNYTMIAFDACGDTATADFQWPEPGIGPMRYVSADNTACLDGTGGEMVQFWGFTSGVTVTLLSGPATAQSTKPGYAYLEHYTYPKSYQDTLSADTLYLSDLAPGVYVYRISDNCGHSLTDSFAMNSAFAVGLERSFGFQRGCNDSNTINFKFRRDFGTSSLANIFYQVTDVTTGTVLYTHQFGDPSGADSILYAPPGMYVLTAQYSDSGINITDGHICSSLSDTIIVPPYIHPVLTSVTGTGCSGSLTITALMDSTTGVAPYTYQLISGPQTTGLQSGNKFSVQRYGVYSVISFDACGNQATASVTLDSLALSPAVVYTSTSGCFSVAIGGQTYTVNTVLTDTLRKVSGCDSLIHIDSVFVKGNSDPLPLLNAKADTFCGTTGGTIIAAQTYPSYLWSDGSTTRMITVMQPGAYILTVTDIQGCQLSDTAVVAMVDSPFIAGGWVSDTTVCKDNPLVLHLMPNAPNSHYLWSDAAPFGLDRNITDSGLYVFTISNQCASTSYTLIAHGMECDESLYVPNAFSPNGDGVNDVFLVFPSYNVKLINIKIFDRWGEKVYEGNSESAGWDGRYRGADAPAGPYVYEMYAAWPTGNTFHKKGGLTLIR